MLAIGAGIGLGALAMHMMSRANPISAPASPPNRPADPPAPGWSPVHPAKKPAKQERNSVTVRVPATSANIGPGYDVLGMAVDMWQEIKVTRAEEFSITCEGEGADKLPLDETNLVVVGIKRAFDECGKPMPPVKIHCINKIPFARGLGSSSAAIVGGLVAGLALAGEEVAVWGDDPMCYSGNSIEPETMLQLASGIEGHPDNVCPAIYGGIQIGVDITAADGPQRWRSCNVPYPRTLQLVAFIPDSTGVTSELRACLDDKVTRAEAVFNISRTALLMMSLSTGNMQNLRWATQDMLHQPQRGAKVYKHLLPVMEAALAAGAHGCYLSGAGPTVLAITSGAAGDSFTQSSSERCERAVADAMQKAADACGETGRMFITTPSNRGAHVIAADPPYSKAVLRYPGDV